MNIYLRSFIIGSSIPVVFLFYLLVANISVNVRNCLDNFRNCPDNFRNYSYESYSILAPLYFGLMNTLSLYFSQKLVWTLSQRLFYISVLSIIIIIIIAKVSGSYNYSESEWKRYYIFITMMHLITYNIIIYLLESNI